jgi:hypothetical protein
VPDNSRAHDALVLTRRSASGLSGREIEAMTAAMSRSLTFRVLEAIFRILMAVSWLQRRGVGSGRIPYAHPR